MPVKGSPGRCPGNDKPYAITETLALGHEVRTDVAEVQPASLASLGAALALASALQEALARRLGIETRELGLEVAQRPSVLGGHTHSLFMFDQASGGAGYAPRLLDDFAAVLRDARAVLDCVNECETGCSSCVLVADLHAQQALLDRKSALEFTEASIAAIAEPDVEDRAGPNSTLCINVADALSRRFVPGSTCTIYVHDAFDITALTEEPFRTLFAGAKRAGCAARVALSPAVFEKLDDAQRRGLRDTANRSGFGLWTGDAAKGANGAPLLATFGHDQASSGWYSRDPLAQSINAGWGTGGEFPAVAAQIGALPQLQPVEPDALERASKPGDRVRIIPPEAGRPLRQFGISLVKGIIQPELEAAGLWRSGQLVRLAYIRTDI